MVFRLRCRPWTLAAGCSLFAFAPDAALAQAPAADAAESPLAVEPKTPEELFRAVLFTVQLDRPAVARRYLDAFIAANPDDELLLKLRNQHGTATFVELARIEELRPASQDLLARVRGVALARINDPAVIDTLIDRLSGTPRERDAALVEFRHLRARGVPPLLRRVNSELKPIPQDLAIATLVAIGQDAVAPLIGALQGGPEPVQGLAASALGMIGGKAAETALLDPAFGPRSSEAVRRTARMALARIQSGDPARTDLVHSSGLGRQLEQQALSWFRQTADVEAGEDGLVAVWTWDSQEQGLIEHRATPEKASLYFAEIAARQAADIAAESRDPQVLLLAVLMARDVAGAGWDQPIPEGPGTAHDLALQTGPQMAEDVLKLALREQQPGAALTALRVLGENGSRGLLTSGPSVLEALNSAERRLQFAAAETILQWDPQSSFPQSGRVVEILARTLSGDSRRDSVVIDPNPQRAGEVGGFLNTLGFDPRIASTGAEGFTEAATRGDVALAVVHLNSIRWDLSETVANLRADARTKGLPIAIYGPPGMEDRARHLEESYPRVRYLREATNSFEVSEQLKSLMAQVSPPPLTEMQRDQQRQSAAFWLRHIADGQRTKIFDLRPAEPALAEAVNDPRVGRSALIALGAVPTATAQQRLLDSALGNSEAGLRATAARQLAFHIQQFGLLLSMSDVGRLKSAADSEPEPAVNSALSAVIGSLKPAPEIVRERLLSSPQSEAPLPLGAAP